MLFFNHELCNDSWFIYVFWWQPQNNHQSCGFEVFKDTKILPFCFDFEVSPKRPGGVNHQISRPTFFFEKKIGRFLSSNQKSFFPDVPQIKEIKMTNCIVWIFILAYHEVKQARTTCLSMNISQSLMVTAKMTEPLGNGFFYIWINRRMLTKHRISETAAEVVLTLR